MINVRVGADSQEMTPNRKCRDVREANVDTVINVNVY